MNIASGARDKKDAAKVLRFSASLLIASYSDGDGHDDDDDDGHDDDDDCEDYHIVMTMMMMTRMISIMI